MTVLKFEDHFCKNEEPHSDGEPVPRVYHDGLCQECYQAACHEKEEDCGVEDCQECCPHDERDHGICLDCAHEEDPGAAIDRAMDYYEGDR